MTPPDPNSPPPLKELSGRIGKYEIVRPLGKGAMGIVYLAHDTDLERDVALKVMVAQIADDPELKQRFEREAKTVARMTHPNVVAIFDRGYHTDGSPYIAMELLKGQDLQKAVRQTPPLSLDRKVGIIVQVLAGLSHAHEHGIVHRDIKPANIFINVDGAVKIMDFGVARLTTASMTGTGNIVGTADYMSPEQVKGAKVDGRSDLFSVGCMLYELLAGQRPFHSDNLMAIFYKITHEEVNFSLLPQTPDYLALQPILERALAKNLEDRYQNAYEFAMALREYLEGHATSRSGEHALEQLVDLRPPGGTLGGSRTNVGATIVDAGADEVGSGGATVGMPGTGAGTSGARGSTARMEMGATTVERGAGARRPPPPSAARRPATPAARPAPPAKSGVGAGLLFVGVAAIVAVAAGAVYFFVLKPKETPDPVPVAVVTPAPPEATTLPPTPEPTPTVIATPPTAAPIAPLGEVKGKAAGLVKTAHAAMAKGDYDRAIEQAQSALREDPQNQQAQQIVDNALKGQKAQGHFRQAEDALRQSQFADAAREAEAGRALAPWDARGPALLTRVQEAEQKAQRQAQDAQRQAEQQKQAQNAALLSGYMAKAAGELAADRYDSAIALYDEVLKVDPQNQAAISAKTNAVVAKKMAEAAAGQAKVASGGKAFVNGKTDAKSTDARGGNVPDGFEDSAGISVKKASAGSELPGRLSFEVEPASVKAGEKYTIRIVFTNEGTASVQVQEMIVTTLADGRKMSGPVPPAVKEVAPHQKETLLTLTDFWKDVQSWSMEVIVRTPRGDTYRNQVLWR